MSTTEKIVDRIRKLLALAGNNTNPNEAANAAAEAQRLMFAHKIAEAMVDSAPEELRERAEPHVVDPEESNKTSIMPTWMGCLMAAICKTSFCEPIQLKREGGIACFSIVGRRSDVEATTYLYRYLRNEIDRLCREANGGFGRTWVNNFRMGAVAVVGVRLSESRAEQLRQFKTAADLGNAGATTALAIVNRQAMEVADAFKKAYPRVRQAGGSYRRDADGRAAGERAGAGIGLPGGNRAIGSGARLLGSAS